MVEHELGELSAVDEDDPGTDPIRVPLSFRGERRRRDHHALRRPRSLKDADEGLDDRPADRGLPALGLNVDHVEAELVLAYDAV